MNINEALETLNQSFVVSANRYAYYAKEVETWFSFDAAELSLLTGLYNDPDTSDDAYSLWCAQTISHPMRPRRR